MSSADTPYFRVRNLSDRVSPTAQDLLSGKPGNNLIPNCGAASLIIPISSGEGGVAGSPSEITLPAVATKSSKPLGVQRMLYRLGEPLEFFS